MKPSMVTFQFLFFRTKKRFCSSTGWLGIWPQVAFGASSVNVSRSKVICHSKDPDVGVGQSWWLGFYLQLSLHDGFKDGYDIWHIHTSYTIIRMIYAKRHSWYLFITFHINQVLMSSGSWTSKCIFGFQFATSNIFGGHEYIQGIMTCHLCSCFTHLDVGLTTPLEVLEIWYSLYSPLKIGRDPKNPQGKNFIFHSSFFVRGYVCETSGWGSIWRIRRNNGESRLVTGEICFPTIHSFSICGPVPLVVGLVGFLDGIHLMEHDFCWCNWKMQLMETKTSLLETKHTKNIHWCND